MVRRNCLCPEEIIKIEISKCFLIGIVAFSLSGFRHNPIVDGQTQTLHLGLLRHLLALSILNEHTTDL